MKASFREGGSCSSGGSGSGSSTSEERRTIIVERSAGSFGFTLQSYGIHYREEKDVEVITYVDFVDPNGPAYRAGLRTGDVILSINGQDVERVNHTALVSIIQSCPSRIRMVVLFENCVRKVELHMRYIHLQRELQRKEQEYQKMCATELILINKLSVPRRGSLNTNTMTHTSASSGYGQQHYGWDSYGYGCNSVMQPRSSKSMPRCILKSSHSFIQPSSSGYDGQREGCSTAERRKDHSRNAGASSSGCFKRSSYFCIGNSGGCECDSCYREEKMRRELGASKTSKTTAGAQLQRPKSCHFTSCYQATKEDYQPISQPADQNCRVDYMSKSYGGYGFGYHYSVASTSSSPHHRPSQQNTPRKQCGADYAVIRTPDRRALPKSAEDLLVAQFREQCQVRANALPPTPSIASTGSAGSSETISFYTRPPQPKPVASTHKAHSQLQRSRPDRHGSMTKPVCEDEGGFDQIRSFRTLPLVKKPM